MLPTRPAGSTPLAPSGKGASDPRAGPGRGGSPNESTAPAGEEQHLPPEAAQIYAGWAQLVERIRFSQTDGMAELYHLFSKGVRFYLCRQLGIQELDDKVHDIFVVVVQAIRRGNCANPSG